MSLCSHRDRETNACVCLPVCLWMPHCNTLMTRCLPADRWLKVRGVSVSTGGQRCYSQIPPHVSVKAVVCHTRIWTALLKHIIPCQRSPQAFTTLTLFFAKLKQMGKKGASAAQREAEPCYFYDTTTLLFAALVSCQLCLCGFNIPSMWFHLFCNFTRFAWITLKKWFFV